MVKGITNWKHGCECYIFMSRYYIILTNTVLASGTFWHLLAGSSVTALSPPLATLSCWKNHLTSERLEISYILHGWENSPENPIRRGIKTLKQIRSIKRYMSVVWPTSTLIKECAWPFHHLRPVLQYLNLHDWNKIYHSLLSEFATVVESFTF